MRDLSLGDCCRLKTLPSFICYLTELRVMYLKSCSQLTALPTSPAGFVGGGGVSSFHSGIEFGRSRTG
jgi:hypothetical protein